MRLAALAMLVVCLWCPPEALPVDLSDVPIADGFDFPVGPPDADGYYKFRGFRTGGHRGEDWNGLRGGNSDLGAPVYSIGHGLVIYARDARRAWGKVVVVRHRYREGGRIIAIDSLYGHLDRMTVREGQRVGRGQKLGTIGTNRGRYTAHLHFEIHKNLAIVKNSTVARGDLTNYHIPTQFINAHRRLHGGPASSSLIARLFKGRPGADPPDPTPTPEPERAKKPETEPERKPAKEPEPVKKPEPEPVKTLEKIPEKKPESKPGRDEDKPPDNVSRKESPMPEQAREAPEPAPVPRQRTDSGFTWGFKAVPGDDG